MMHIQRPKRIDLKNKFRTTFEIEAVAEYARADYFDPLTSRRVARNVHKHPDIL